MHGQHGQAKRPFPGLSGASAGLIPNDFAMGQFEEADPNKLIATCEFIVQQIAGTIIRKGDGDIRLGRRRNRLKVRHHFIGEETHGLSHSLARYPAPSVEL